MLFSDRPRTHYPSAPVHEVICQLRFPTILSINNVEPADFQEIIRDTFPQYARRQDMPAPQPLPPGAAGAPKATPVTNYHFISADNHWKLNLTKDFIALSTLRYTGWEDFAHHPQEKTCSGHSQIFGFRAVCDPHHSTPCFCNQCPDGQESPDHLLL